MATSENRPLVFTDDVTDDVSQILQNWLDSVAG